ncbi:uncharacterized protein LOC142628705 [Castanea sativa]|uniref:uncharacterized protein LOC142628705 n=1 Tax=Castanea sativa TaxID=21020 RepID=UPI003F653263
MKKYLTKAKRRVQKFKEASFVQLPREENIEADALATAASTGGVMDEFGVPRVLVSDNGRQFDNTPFRDFCKQLGIRNHYFSPSYPWANGQAQVANWSLLKIIKTQLEGAKEVWPNELLGVLWAYRTTGRTPTGETPFKLAYGSKAVIPTEVHMANHRVMKY